MMPNWRQTPAGYRAQQQQEQTPSSGYFGSGSSAEEASVHFVSPTAVFQENMSLEMLTDVQPLDQGGFCVVCSCIYGGQRAVLKVPKPQGPDNAVADLMVEIGIYRRISEQGGHRNIARAFGTGFHVVQGKPSPFLVLEMLEGGNLAQAIERIRASDTDGGRTWSDPVPRLPVALELADALHFLHSQAVPGGFVLHR